MSNYDLTINRIAGWNIDHTKRAKELLAAFDKLSSMNTEQPSWEGVTDPKTVVDTVLAHVEHTMTTGEALAKARNTAEFKISRALIEEVSSNLDSYVSQLQDDFHVQAKRYADAVAKLPREFSADDLANFTAEEFDAYRVAKESVAVIHSVKSWLQEVGEVIPNQSLALGDSSPYFLVVDPEDLGLYASIAVSDSRGWDNAYRAIDPVLAKAVRDGATLRIALPTEAKAVVTEYEQQRTGVTKDVWNTIRTEAGSW